MFSVASRLSSFLMSSSGGRFSGLMPRSIKVFRNDIIDFTRCLRIDFALFPDVKKMVVNQRASYAIQNFLSTSRFVPSGSLAGRCRLVFFQAVFLELYSAFALIKYYPELIEYIHIHRCFYLKTAVLQNYVGHWTRDFAQRASFQPVAVSHYNTIILSSGILATKGIALGCFFLTRANIFSMSKPSATTFPLTRTIYWFSRPFLSSSKNASNSWT